MKKLFCILAILLCAAGIFYGPVTVILGGGGITSLIGIVFWEALMLALLRVLVRAFRKKDTVPINRPTEPPSVSRMKTSEEEISSDAEELWEYKN